MRNTRPGYRGGYEEHASAQVTPDGKKKSGKKWIILACIAVVYVILCMILKYQILIPTVILLVLAVVIAVNRRILGKRRKKGKGGEVEQYQLNDKEVEKLSGYFANRDETYISSLGNGYIMNFLAKGNLRRGFAVISNRRVYFRGSCFSGSGKKLLKTDEERTVDISDVTGSGFLYKRYLGILPGLFAALAALLYGIISSGACAIYKSQETSYYQDYANPIKEQLDTVKSSAFEEFVYALAEANDAVNSKTELLNNHVDNEYYNDRLYDEYSYFPDDVTSDTVKIIAADNNFDSFIDYVSELAEYNNTVSDRDELIADRNTLIAENQDYANLLDNYYVTSDNAEEVLETMRSNLEERYNAYMQDASEEFREATAFTALAGILFTFFISCFLVFLDYLKKRKTLFRIEYAGGAIAFDVSFYAKAEIEDFQKQLRRTKDLYEQNSAANLSSLTAAMQQTAAAQSQAAFQTAQTQTAGGVSDELRKYADLLKDGLITQEEYDALKKKALGL